MQAKLMPQPLLYSFRRCPYAIRARLALRHASIPLEIREVALRNKPAEMLALSPKGTVPVLQLPDGHVIDQSLEIMIWALNQHDPDGWLSQAPRQAMQALIDTNDGPFKQLLDRYKYPERHPERARSDYRDEAVSLMLGPLNQQLLAHQQAGRRYLLGDGPSLADMAIVPFVRQFAQADAAWFDASPLSALRAWLRQIVGSDLFVAVMAKT
jgi:glutathione S-transferase